MASAAGGSGAGGGDRCPSGEKGTTRVGRRSKKPSAFHGYILWDKRYIVLKSDDQTPRPASQHASPRPASPQNSPRAALSRQGSPAHSPSPHLMRR